MAYKKRESVNTKRPTAQDRHIPVDLKICSPPKHEKTYRNQPAARHERDESLLRLSSTIAVEVLRLCRTKPHDEHGGCEYSTAKKPNERQSHYALTETVDSLED